MLPLQCAAMDGEQVPTPNHQPRRNRAMVSATLQGNHTHETVDGVHVHIWQRDGKYIARGRHQGHAFGEQLGSDERQAIARLRQLLTEIENGSFVPPSEARMAPLRRGRVPRLTVRELCNEFLSEKRQIRGQKTANDYTSRLAPVLDFAEQASSLRRWPLAANIDRMFAVELRTHLHQIKTTRNGRAGGAAKPLSARQIINILECLRTVLAWARQASVRKLPVDWANPFTPELVGSVPEKDPLREDALPLERRIQFVEEMDLWQLLHLSISVVLPLRPEEATGLLVSDVNFEKSWLVFGTRFGGSDFTKGHTSFKLPFPAELEPILRACIASRSGGPLLRKASAFFGRRNCASVASASELQHKLDERLAEIATDSITCANDQKAVFRSLLSALGGVSTDLLATNFKTLARKIGVESVSIKTLRSSVTTTMEAAGLSHLAMRYLTSHTTADILNDYASLDIVAQMRIYFHKIQPLLDAIATQCQRLGIAGCDKAA